MTHSPCLTCGACCASFRVSFYRGEAIPGPGAVPEELVEPVSSFLVAMRGTTTAPPRCVSLEGEVGQACHCTIYPLRSSTCREFAASWEADQPSEACDAARARHGLPPLAREDWWPRTPSRPRRVA